MSGSGITGDWAALDAAIARLDGLANAVPRAMAKAAPKIQASARANYAANKGPDGVKWAKNKDGTYPSLNRPAAGVTFTAQGTTLVGAAEDVLKYHQDGNDRLPRRPVFPEPGTIPAPWQTIINDALRSELGDSTT